MQEKNLIAQLVENLSQDSEFQKLDEAGKTKFLRLMNKADSQKINILLTGGTGVGKSSTINALFGSQKAKVGVGVDPETMEMKEFDLNGIVLYDSPGLGDGKQKDIEHSKKIQDLLYKLDKDHQPLIDLVLVLLDGTSRDYGTAYQLINNVIIPNLGEDKSRLLIAINKCDTAMSGRGWDFEKNEPKENLVNFLNEKVKSTKRRIKEATGVDVDIIYYSAGYKEDGEEQLPYNLSKLLAFMLKHTPAKKRCIIEKDLNKNKKMWENDEDVVKHQEEVKQSLWDSLSNLAEEVLKTIPGGPVIIAAGKLAKSVANTVTNVVSSVWGGIKSVFGW